MFGEVRDLARQRPMLTQIYTVSNADEARSISAIGVDHIGTVVGPGQFRSEIPLAAAATVAAAIAKPTKFSALFLSADLALIEAWTRELRPEILHLGGGPATISPDGVGRLKATLAGTLIMMSIPVTGEESLSVARSYDQIADLLLLDSARSSDGKIGALGVTHDWSISRRIVELVHIPVVLAGGLGPENVAEAIRAVRPAGVDSKTRTDRDGSNAKDLERVRLFHQAARAAL
jgi:phosphoribosylanthranilate isomerase